MTDTTARPTATTARRLRAGARRTVGALDAWTLQAFNPPVARPVRVRPADRES